MKRLIVGMLGAAGLGVGMGLAGDEPVAGVRLVAAEAQAVQAPAAPAAPRMTRTRAAAPAVTTLTIEQQNQMVAQYCGTCHSDRAKAGGLSLASFDAAHVVEHADEAEKMIRKLRTGMMPPANAKRPEGDGLLALVTAFETRIDAAAAANPNPGSRPFQRLNRAEYTRAVQELLDLPVDVTAFLPSDTISGGFDNVADVQASSATVMEGYLRAASQISRLAVGDRGASAGSTTYSVGRTMSQMRHVEGAPMGTRGGISVVHTFPADGEYVFKINLHNEPLGGLFGRSTVGAMSLTEQVEISINGERAAVMPLNVRMSESDPANNLEPETPPIYVQAGPQRVSAAFVTNFDAPPDDLLAPIENTLADVSIGLGITVLPHLRDFTIRGPLSVTGVSDSSSRRRIFTCRPTTAAEEAPCAAEIVRRLASQAFRSPVSADDFEGLMGFYEQGRAKADFENGIRFAIQAILASPQFLFRTEHAPATLRAGENYRLNDLDLASRLSFFLWGTVPDEELLKVASAGRLSAPAVLRQQVSRMLADSRSEAMATRFGAQWLRLQDLDQLIPDYLHYPQYDDTLAASFRRETELLFDSIVREDRNVLDLLTADYTFLNERLSGHYGFGSVTGNAFRRVPVPDERRGLLGQGSILAMTSIADRTSPVRRGLWVMEVLLGTEPPPPPPNVPALEDIGASAEGRLLSVREKMEQHRANPACTSCHRVIDPLGLALENFDVTGAWRIKDNEVPIDASGDLYDGTKMDGPAGLRNALLKHQDVVLMSFTESLMTYAIGRRVEAYDMPTVRAIVRDAAAEGHKMSAYIMGVINSPAFRMGRGVEMTDLDMMAGRRR
jgi:mono/diheme cytochrome c family protein